MRRSAAKAALLSIGALACLGGAPARALAQAGGGGDGGDGGGAAAAHDEAGFIEMPTHVIDVTAEERRSREHEERRVRREEPRWPEPQIEMRGGLGTAVLPHFIVVTNDAIERLPELCRSLEPLHAAFTEFFASLGLPRRNVTRVRIRLFRDHASFAEYSRRTGNGGLREHYDPDRNEIVLTSLDDPRDTWETVCHEVAHRFTEVHFAVKPTWMDEGIATYLAQSVRAEDGTVVAGGRSPGFDQLLAESCRTGRTVSLRTLLSLRHEQFHCEDEDRELMLYAQSYGFVTWLIEQSRASRVDARRIAQFLLEAGAGRGGPENLERVLGRRLDDLDAAVRARFTTMR